MSPRSNSVKIRVTVLCARNLGKGSKKKLQKIMENSIIGGGSRPIMEFSIIVFYFF